MMRILNATCCFSMLILTTTLSAQAPPQDGTFVKICSLHGEANQGGNAYHNDATCNLPGDFPIDRSYHQQGANFAGGGASSNLSVADIPAGIHIDVSGNYYWSIVQPMKMVILDQDGPVVRQFSVHLYCGPSGGFGGGCSVNVDVYARKR